jgi:hypothetical protein
MERYVGDRGAALVFIGFVSSARLCRRPHWLASGRPARRSRGRKSEAGDYVTCLFARVRQAVAGERSDAGLEHAINKWRNRLSDPIERVMEYDSNY